MDKFIEIPVTGLPSNEKQLVSVSGVKLIDEATATATATTIHYSDGTVTTVTHAADADFSVLLALQNAMKQALIKPWTDLVPVEVSLNVAVSGIANS